MIQHFMRVVGALAIATAALLLPMTSGATPAAPKVQTSELEGVFDHTFGPAGGLSYTGAVVVVVQDGKVILTKGYGYEDFAHTRPIDPNRSLFVVASITKTFIAQRIAQLLQAGVIHSIDDPANRYFKTLRIPDNRGHAITIRDLLTHQAGFADADLSMVIQPDGEREPTAEDFRRTMPPFIRAAETGSVYSNFSLALMGLMIRDLTGQSLSNALAQGLWRPLGMTSTHFPSARDRQVLTQAQAFYPDGSRVDLPNDIADNAVVRQGAGGLATTGYDMARYMIGTLGGNPALEIPSTVSDATRQLMFSRLASASPLVQGYGTAFMLNDWNGFAIVEHGGRGLARLSYMTLIPTKHLGFFVSVTAENGAPSPSDLWGGIAGHPGRMAPRKDAPVKLPSLFSLRASYLVPLLGQLQPPSIAGLAPPQKDLSQYAGSYRSARRIAWSPLYLLDVLLKGEVAKVSIRSDGLAVGATHGYRALAKDVFWRDPKAERGPGYNNLVVFRRGPDGQLRDMVFGYTDTVYDRLAPWQAPEAALQAFQFSALIAATGLLALLWPWRSLARWPAFILPLLLVSLPFLFFGFWPKGAPSPFNSVLVTRVDMLPFEIAGFSAVLAALSLIGFALVGWRRRPEGWRAWFMRVHLTVLAIAAPFMAWSLFALHIA